MRKLNKPAENPEEVYLKCISKIQNANLKNRLTACKNLVIEASQEFENKVSTLQLHTINRETIINGNVTAKEMEDIYTLRMARKDTPGRALYDKILAAPAHGICPLCSHRLATTLDHHLPKAQYPRLSVVPINLVPSCKDCNFLKLYNYPTIPEQETLNPYFENIQDDVWLDGKLIETTPPSIKFFVSSPPHWSALLTDRVRFQFDKLLLNSLYSANAAVELVQINHQLKTLHNISGAKGVYNYLLECFESRTQANMNSWQTIMYRTIANNLWYCNVGLKLQVQI